MVREANASKPAVAVMQKPIRSCSALEWINRLKDLMLDSVRFRFGAVKRCGFLWVPGQEF